MDDVNISVEDIVLDGTSPLSPENLHAALSQQAPALAHGQLAAIAAAVGDSLRSRLGGEPR